MSMQWKKQDTTGEEITIAIDAASSELYDEEKGVYFFPGESRMKGEKIYRDAREMTDTMRNWWENFPLFPLRMGSGRMTGKAGNT